MEKRVKLVRTGRGEAGADSSVIEREDEASFEVEASESAMLVAKVEIRGCDSGLRDGDSIMRSGFAEFERED